MYTDTIAPFKEGCATVFLAYIVPLSTPNNSAKCQVLFHQKWLNFGNKCDPSWSFGMIGMICLQIPLFKVKQCSSSALSHPCYLHFKLTLSLIVNVVVGQFIFHRKLFTELLSAQA